MKEGLHLLSDLLFDLLVTYSRLVDLVVSWHDLQVRDSLQPVIPCLPCVMSQPVCIFDKL